MKIGVISDIHSNIVAFRACTKYMEDAGCDEYLFLGDYISDTPYTRETLDYLYDFTAAHTCSLLRGNREEYMLSQQEAIKAGDTDRLWSYNSASGNLLFAYDQLTESDILFFDVMPITFDYQKPGLPTIRCCHGSPENARELIQLNSDRARYWLDNIPYDYLLCAHTHFPGEYSYHGKHYYNSGCVGISIGDAGFAQCMILQDVEENGKIIWKPAFLRIPYNNYKVVRDMAGSGLLDKAPWFINSNIQILLTGIDNSAKMVELATRLSEEAGELKGWPLTKEKYFEQAAKELKIPDYRTSGKIFTDRHI